MVDNGDFRHVDTADWLFGPHLGLAADADLPMVRGWHEDFDPQRIDLRQSEHRTLFVSILAGHYSVLAVFVASFMLELVRSFSSAYFPNTWQMALGIFLLIVIRFLPRGIGSLWLGWRRRKGAGT